MLNLLGVILTIMTDEQLLESINQIVATQLEPINKDLKTIKARVKKIDKTQDISIRMFDERIVTNEKDIDQIKTTLSMSSKQ